MDIVDRLRANYGDTDSSADAHMALEAADEIERLRADLDLRNQTALDRKEIIAKLEAEFAAERGRYEEALSYASCLMCSLWEQHYKLDAPEWELLPDLLGVLTQIDNASVGLVEKGAAAERERCALVAACHSPQDWSPEGMRNGIVATIREGE